MVNFSDKPASEFSPLHVIHLITKPRLLCRSAYIFAPLTSPHDLSTLRSDLRSELIPNHEDPSIQQTILRVGSSRSACTSLILPPPR